jgi:hypothetical protein
LGCFGIVDGKTPNGGSFVKAVRQRVQGTLLTGNGRTALLLRDARPEAATAEVLYLRYAFVTQGVESHVLPAFVLDDWGKEIKSLELYEWVREYGDQFPRAEVFGFDLSGKATQVFLRELELVSKLPCYAYPTKETPLAAGVLVEAILLPDPGVTTVEKAKRPPATEVGQPLRSARVSWWRANPLLTSFGFSLV